MSAIRVLIADSQWLLAQALRMALGSFADLEIIEDFPSSGPSAVEAAALWRPNVLLLEHWISEMEGPAVTRKVVTRVPECKVIILGWFFGLQEIERALNAQAAGFLPKSASVEQVAEAIRRAHAGESPVLAEQLDKLTKKLERRSDLTDEVTERLAQLTRREIEVLLMLSRGTPLQNAADELFISQSTLKVHITNILKKTGARSHGEAVAMAVRAGFIQM